MLLCWLCWHIFFLYAENYKVWCSTNWQTWYRNYWSGRHATHTTHNIHIKWTTCFFFINGIFILIGAFATQVQATPGHLCTVIYTHISPNAIPQLSHYDLHSIPVITVMTTGHRTREWIVSLLIFTIFQNHAHCARSMAMNQSCTVIVLRERLKTGKWNNFS